MENVSRGSQHDRTVSYSIISHFSCRLDDLCNGEKKRFFSQRQEIKIKLKRLNTRDVEKLFKKVKEALEVSQLG